MTISRLKLYHYPATRSVRVKWLLHELLEDDFDIEVVPLYEGVQYSDEYLQKNPNHNVPALEIMLESGAMVSMLADLYPEKALAPAPQPFSKARADYLQMLHFGTSWMDMMLWQIRIHTHLLGPDADKKTIERYNTKWTQEVEPQMIARLKEHDFICGDTFSAADCVMGQNVMWAKAYGLCQPTEFKEYIGRLSQRPAFGKAYSDLGDFSLAPPPAKAKTLAKNFNG
jgi:glutathione S-transferase